MHAPLKRSDDLVPERVRQVEPTTFQQFRARYNLSTETLAERIVARHQDAIKIKKTHVAVRNLSRILNSALTLSNRTGFHAMSLRDLSDHSGVSMGALYTYFDSKETLLAMILHTVAEAVEDVLAAPLADLDSAPADRLRWLITRHVHLTEAMLPWFFFVFMEAKAFPQDARASAKSYEQRTEALIEEILKAGRNGGVFGIDDTAMTATLIKPLLQDWYVKRAKYRRRAIGPDRFALSVIEFVEASILRPAVPARSKAASPRRRTARQ